MTWFTHPMEYEFFRHGLLVAMMVGGVCGLMGTVVVLRRMSYIGHGLSHSIFGGAVVAYIVGINFYIGAGIWGFFSALLINATARRRNIGADAAIGIVTTASFAPWCRPDQSSIGRLPAISRRRCSATSWASPSRTSSSSPQSRRWSPSARWSFTVTFSSPRFDPELAAVFGIPSSWIETGFALALAAVIVASMNIVGVTLIAAAIVIPPSTARLLTNSFGTMMLLSTAIGVFGGAVGMFISFHQDISSGSAIVLFNAGFFAVVYASTAIWHWYVARRFPGAALAPDRQVGKAAFPNLD